jgi:hypothetical protein
MYLINFSLYPYDLFHVYNNIMNRFNIDITPDYWVMPNRARFAEWIYTTFRYTSKYEEGNSGFQLFVHQRFVKDYLQYNSPYRGILLYHGLGVGKTCASVVAAEILMKRMDVVVLLPASLRQNYKDEIKKCGSSLYTQNQKWKFVSSKTDKDTVSRFEKQYRIGRSTIEKYEGLWVASEDGTPFEGMDDKAKTKLSAFLDDLIEEKYTFIHYNGLSRDMLQGMRSDAFNNKVIIIDEVHNFISTAQKPKTLAHTLYNKLLDSKYSKFICLSGTPIINHPVELAYLINLIKGDELIYNIKCTIKPNSDTHEAISHVMDRSIYVDSYEIVLEKSIVQFTLLPDGYEFQNKALNRVARSKDLVRHTQIVQMLLHDMAAMGVEIKEIYGKAYDMRRSSVLPTSLEEFGKYFIDTSSLKMKNTLMFMRRAAGAVSFYEKYDEELYPSRSKINIVPVTMGKDQFDVYYNARKKEIDQESKSLTYAAKKSQSADDDVFAAGNIYKTFSRAACLFSFPRGMVRPYPSNMRETQRELDTLDAWDEVAPTEENHETSNKNDTYQDRIDLLLKGLAKKKEEYLSLNNIKGCSPKYFEILKRISVCKGPALIYSQFRAVEGLGMFSMTLEANGFCELDIKKVNGEWHLDVAKEDMHKKKYVRFLSKNNKMPILLSIFNSEYEKLPPSLVREIIAMQTHVDPVDVNNTDRNMHGKVCQIMMITQSGAEGISLKNVRQVHIMEPYWNSIRIQQVVGRAIRARSHVDLPRAERHVDIYMYVMKLKESQRNKFILKTKDDGHSTDELVLNIASRKKKIIDEFLSCIKKAGVDCQLHNDASKCMTLPITMAPSTMVVSKNLQSEMSDARFAHTYLTKAVTTQSASKVIKFKDGAGNDHTCGLIEPDNILFDYDVYIRMKRIKVVGYLKDGRVELYS